MARPKNCKRCNKPKRPRGRIFANKEGYCQCGRPPKIDANVLQKLEDAFSNAFPDREACFYAGISPTTLYNYQEQNPEFVERKEALKLSPNLSARKTIVNSITDPNHAWRWLEKKDPEFKPTSKVEHSGSIDVADLTENMSDKEKVALLALRAARRERIEAESKKLQ